MKFGWCVWERGVLFSGTEPQNRGETQSKALLAFGLKQKDWFLWNYWKGVGFMITIYKHIQNSQNSQLFKKVFFRIWIQLYNKKSRTKRRFSDFCIFCLFWIWTLKAKIENSDMGCTWNHGRVCERLGYYHHCVCERLWHHSYGMRERLGYHYHCVCERLGWYRYDRDPLPLTPLLCVTHIRDIYTCLLKNTTSLACTGVTPDRYTSRPACCLEAFRPDASPHLSRAQHKLGSSLLWAWLGHLKWTATSFVTKQVSRRPQIHDGQAWWSNRFHWLMLQDFVVLFLSLLFVKSVIIWLRSRL